MADVSIIIPTFNRPTYLRNAIDSILNQTFQDFELIVVDDASTAETLDVIRSFHDDRIKYFHHETRKGGAAARNTGIVNSKCEYIAFLDDDDEWFPDKLAKQMDLLLASPPAVGCVYTGYVIQDSLTGKINGQMIPQKRGDLSKDLRISNCIGGTSTALIRKKCLEKVGLFDETLPSFQDYDLWIRLSEWFQFDYVREPLLRYRVHQKKIWTNLDALSEGIKIMVRKHGASRPLRKYLSVRSLGLGVRYCHEGKLSKGRDSYFRAIRLYPFEIRHYINLGLSLLGTKGFKKVTQSSIWKIMSSAAVNNRKL
jgi:glycosyltransferase involved in cell wall biosynthesis